MNVFARASVVLLSACGLLCAGCPDTEAERQRARAQLERAQELQAEKRADAAAAVEGELADAMAASERAAVTEAGEGAGAGDSAPAYSYKAPEAVAAQHSKVGETIPAVPLTTVAGEEVDLHGLCQQGELLAVIYTGLGCPVTRKYAPLLKERLTAFTEEGVRVLIVDPNPADSPVDLAARAAELGWDAWTVVHDTDQSLTRALGAERTSACYVLDPQGVVRYEGAFDDQIGIGYQRPTARHRYLEDALIALLAGEEVAVAATTAPGCLITPPRQTQ